MLSYFQTGKTSYFANKQQRKVVSSAQTSVLTTWACLLACAHICLCFLFNSLCLITVRRHDPPPLETNRELRRSEEISMSEREREAEMRTSHSFPLVAPVNRWSGEFNPVLAACLWAAFRSNSCMHLCVCLCMRPLIFQCHTQNSRSLRANTAACVTVLLDVPNRLSQIYFDMPYTAGLSRAGVFPSRQ